MLANPIINFTIKRINKGLKRFSVLSFLEFYFTIKRINKGLKLPQTIFNAHKDFTIKRINKGLKPLAKRG